MGNNTLAIDKYPHATFDLNAANIDDIKELDSKIKKNIEMIDNITEFIIPGVQQDLNRDIKILDNITDRRLNTLEKQCEKLEKELAETKDYLIKTAATLVVVVIALIITIFV